MDKIVNNKDTGATRGIYHSSKTIISAVNESVDKYGVSRDKLMAILLHIQRKLKYLPNEALIEVCRLTDITPAQITEISTFYPQLRHVPTGRHIIQICMGTNCYLKGSVAIKEALLKHLNIPEGESCSPDNEFSIEESECLGACSIAPVVRIDDKLYGGVDPLKVDVLLMDFRKSLLTRSNIRNRNPQGEVDAEIRVGIGTCCVAGGSKEVLTKVVEFRDLYGLNIRIKPVGCTGACGFTPILEIVWNDGTIKRYTNVEPCDIKKILSMNFDVNILDEPDEDIDVNWSAREIKLNSFLAGQISLAKALGGTLSPVSLQEYINYGGLSALKRCIGGMERSSIISLIRKSSLSDRSGSVDVSEQLNKITSENGSKLIICHSVENDTGALKDRMFLESFSFRIIEGMIISGYITGISRALFHISESYPLSVKRVQNAILRFREAGMLGTNIQGSDFSFEISLIEEPGDFACGEIIDEIGNMPVIMMDPETFSILPSILSQKSDGTKPGEQGKLANSIIVSLTGKVNTPGIVEVKKNTTIREIIDNFGNGIRDDKRLKGVHIGGLTGGFISKGLLDMPLDHEMFKRIGILLGSANIVVLNEDDSIVDMSIHFITFACRQSCGKCTICRIGTHQLLNILNKFQEGVATEDDLNEIEAISGYLQKGSLCGLGRNAPNAVLSALKYFRKDFGVLQGNDIKFNNKDDKD